MEVEREKRTYFKKQKTHATQFLNIPLLSIIKTINQLTKFLLADLKLLLRKSGSQKSSLSFPLLMAMDYLRAIIQNAGWKGRSGLSLAA